MRVVGGVAAGEATVPHAEGVAGRKHRSRLPCNLLTPDIGGAVEGAPSRGSGTTRGRLVDTAKSFADFSSARRANSLP